MTKLRISTSYDAVWQIKGLDNYFVTKNGVIFNSLTQKSLKRTVKGYTIGYHIQGRFYSLSKLRTMLEKITVIQLPF